MSCNHVNIMGIIRVSQDTEGFHAEKKTFIFKSVVYYC